MATSAPRRGAFRKTVRGVRWLLGGPSDWAGVGSIRRGASLIGEFARAARVSHSPGPGSADRDRVFVNEDSTIDLRATAFSQGLTEEGLRVRLEAKRRQTARIAYATFALACICLLGWLRAALATPLAFSRVMVTLDFLPFCGLFLLMAFYNGLLNFQIRSGRRASWREYLMTEQGFLPR